MRELTEKIILLFLCSTLLFGRSDFIAPVASLLTAIVCTSLLQAFDNRIFHYILAAAFILACFRVETLIFFLPVIVYDLCRKRLPVMLAAAALPPVVHFFETGDLRLPGSVIIFSVIAAALIL